MKIESTYVQVTTAQDLSQPLGYIGTGSVSKPEKAICRIYETISNDHCIPTWVSETGVAVFSNGVHSVQVTAYWLCVE